MHGNNWGMITMVAQSFEKLFCDYLRSGSVAALKLHCSPSISLHGQPLYGISLCVYTGM